MEFCENGAKAVADEATRQRCTPAFFERHDVGQLLERSDRWLNDQGRLTHPMILRESATHYEPIGWDEAFDVLAEELGQLGSPDEAAFYTSGRTSNEAAFLYQLFVRRFGTNNLPDCSNMCHESSGTGLGEVIGIGKGTVLLEDFAQAEAIFVIGQNPGTNHPRMLTTLQQASRRGATIVSVNPLREVALERFVHPQELLNTAAGRATPIASLHLPVRINGDVALLKAIMLAMLEEDDRRLVAGQPSVFDRDFIEASTAGFEAFVEDLRQERWEDLLEACGVAREAVEQAARIAIDSERIIVCWAMGLTQHENGVANVQEVVNLLLLRGSLGKPGAGVCPVRGHSNVQGDRTMGIWERPPAAFLDRLEARYHFAAPRRHGLDTVGAIRAMHEGRIRVFVAMGGNFLSAGPDTAYCAEGLRRCRLTVQISTKLNRSHLVCGRRALILPPVSRTERDLQEGGEQFVTVENSMGIVHPSQGRLEPASPELRSEPAIVARMAEAVLGPEDPVRWRWLVQDYDRIRDEIEACIPGFDSYNLRVRQHGGFALPNAVRDEGRFDTADGKAHFTVHPVPRHRLAPGELLMMTIRSHDQFNTTIYGHDDRYRGIYGSRRVVLVHPEDISALGMVPGQRVDLINEQGGRQRRAHGFLIVPFELPRRSAATYFPEANVLVPIDRTAYRSNTPASKSVVIRIVDASEARQAPETGR